MPTINQLPLITQLSMGDNVVLWVPNQGDSRRASLTTLNEFLGLNFTAVVAETVQTSPVLYSALPTAASAGMGTRAFITDGSTTTFAATVTGGGVNKVPVYSDGTNWKVG